MRGSAWELKFDAERGLLGGFGGLLGGVWVFLEGSGRLNLSYFTCLEGSERLNLSYFACLEGSGRRNQSYFTCLEGSGRLKVSYCTRLEAQNVDKYLTFVRFWDGRLREATCVGFGIVWKALGG